MNERLNKVIVSEYNPKKNPKKSYNLLFNIHHHQREHFKRHHYHQLFWLKRSKIKAKPKGISRIWIGICSFTLMYIFLMHLREWKYARTIRFGYRVRKLKCLLSFAFFLSTLCIISILILLLLIITRKPTHVKVCYVRSFFLSLLLLVLLLLLLFLVRWLMAF